jgi:hypothetical protein
VRGTDTSARTAMDGPTRCSEAGVNRYLSGGCGEYGVAAAGDRVQRRLTVTDARTRRIEWCQALYCEG